MVDDFNMIVDKMFKILLNHVSEEVIDAIPKNEMSALMAGMWNAFNEQHIFMHNIESRVSDIYDYRKQLHTLRKMPYIAQRTDEWYNLRKQRLTASDTAQAIGKGKFGNRDQLINKKVMEMRGESPPFKVMAPMKWGIMFEPMAMRCYTSQNDNVMVYEFGMIPHPEVTCYGASPDGITALGIMTEIKCPYKRKITGEIPDYYELQMQGQMAVCNLKECDYIECDMQVFESYEDYSVMVEDSIANHGIICEFLKDNVTYYEYSDPLLTPKQANVWARELSSREMKRDAAIQLVRIHYWKLRRMFVKRVYFDQGRWDDLVPQIEHFWNSVLHAYSETTNEVMCNHSNKNDDTLEEKKKYKFVSDSDEDGA